MELTKERCISAYNNIRTEIFNKPLLNDSYVKRVQLEFDVFEKLIQEYFKLQMALNKACEKLEDFDMTFNDADFVDVKNRDEWKIWCMKKKE